MEKTTDIMIEVIRKRAEQEAAILAGEFARAANRDREAILAAMQYERWLAECCADAQTGLSTARKDHV